MNIKIVFITLTAFVSYTNYYSQSKEKAQYNYLIYLPKDYSTSTKKFPLVIYLHGASQKGNDLNKPKSYGLPFLVDKGQNFDFIIASPECPDHKYWSADNWFHSLYLDLSARYRIDTTRIYLTGISMGGYGTFIVAMDFPGKFAALVRLCGGCNDDDTSWICNLNKIPIWAFHGTADDKISINETERIFKALESCHGNMKFTRLKNEGHSIESLYEKNPYIYKWMLRQKK